MSWDLLRTHRFISLGMTPRSRDHTQTWATRKLLAKAELSDDVLIALGIVGLEIVQQATPLADQHEKAAARTVILQVRFEMLRQLANALA